MALLKKVSATKTIVAAGDYAANDVVSNSATADTGTAFKFAKISPAHGHPGRIITAIARCSEDLVTWRLRLHLFNGEPLAAEVEMDDNVAFNIKTSDGADKYIGYIDFPAMDDLGVIPAAAQADQLNFAFDPDNGDTLWGVVETLDAEANEAASMTLTITLHSSR